MSTATDTSADTTNPVDHDVCQAAGDPAAARWILTWETGPDAGSSVVLGADRTLVGRAGGAGVRCDDPALEPHHALLFADADQPRLVQLTGRAPVVVDGRDVGDGVLDDGALVELGHSTLRARRRRPPADERVYVRDGSVLRSPRAQPRWDPAPLVPPTTEQGRAATPAGLVPALCAAVAAVTLAVVLDQWMMLAFGVLGLFVAAGTWVAQRIGGVRRSRRSRRAAEREWSTYTSAVAELRDAYVEHIAEATTTLADAMSTIATRDHRLWSRRGTDPDAYVVSLGYGDVVWRPPGAADDERPVLHVARHHDPPPALHTTAVLHHQPITVDLGDGARLALRGAEAWTSAVARSLVVQLAANCGPADVRLMAVTEHPARWDWVADLPHGVAADGAPLVVDPSGAAAAFAALDQPGTPHLVVVTDAAEQLASRTSALRRTMAGGRQPAVIVLVDPGEPTPAVCTAELQCPSGLAGAGGWARWRAHRAGDDVPAAVRLTGLGPDAAVRIAAELHPLVDPDDPFAEDAALPTAVSLAELLQAGGRRLTPAGILARWDAAGPDAQPRAPIGRADGVVDLDLVRDGPHGLIAGTTGSGKSELLRSLVTGLAVCAPPEQLTFVLVDYKGGATFDACAELPHVVGLVTDLDERLADRMLRSLHAELRRREAVLRAHDVADLAGLRAVATTAVLPRLVVVIDELAALVGEQPTFLHTLVGIAQRGRSLGVHLLLATQRPGGILSDDIRANTNIRCALRLPDSTDALDVVGDVTPVSIPRRVPGRAVLRLGPDEHVSFQSACCATELTAIVRAVVDAAHSRDAPAPLRPWCPPLPDVLAADDPRFGDDAGGDDDDADDGDRRGVLGLIDDPDRQRQLPLRWAAGGGHVLLGGGHGSGLTSTLRTVAIAAIEADPAAHVYVVDARGGHGLDGLAELPSCAGVVRTHEPERLRRLLVRLDDELTRRAAAGTSGTAPPLLLLVDGFGELRQLLAEPATDTERAALERILVDGAAGGVVAVLAVSHPGAVPPSVLAHCPRRWLHHVVDRHDALAWGYAVDDVPPPIPGRVLVAPGLHAQLLVRQIPAVDAIDAIDAIGAAAGPTSSPAPIEALPRDVDPATIGRGRRGRASGLLLPAGLGFDSGAPVDLEVPDGEHVLIVGPARSGRTTALWRLVDAWREANPDGWSAVLAPRRRDDDRPGTYAGLAELLVALPSSGAALVAVDDAELVADHDGAPTLASLAAGRRPGLSIVAAGSADALRQSYGHWAGVVRRSRLGIVLAAANDLDGDLLGASLPRRRPIPARPGLAWIVSGGELQLVQLARPPCRAAVPPVA